MRQIIFTRAFSRLYRCRICIHLMAQVVCHEIGGPLAQGQEKQNHLHQTTDHPVLFTSLEKDPVLFTSLSMEDPVLFTSLVNASSIWMIEVSGFREK